MHWWIERAEIWFLTPLVLAFGWMWRQIVTIKSELKDVHAADQAATAERIATVAAAAAANTAKVESQLLQLANQTNNAIDALHAKSNEIRQELNEHRVASAQTFVGKADMEHALDRIMKEISGLRQEVR